MFETKETRFARRVKSLILGFVVLIMTYFACCFLVLVFAENETKIANEAFFSKDPDLVTVFTGDHGRIDFALEKAKMFKGTKVFITGVYDKNTVNSLLPSDPNSTGIDPDFLEIDYLAQNTFGNVISTLQYLKQNRNLKKVLIISHDYHLMRIKSIVNRLAEKEMEEGYTFYYIGIKTDYSKWRNIKILSKEIYKVVRTYGFLLLWVSDVWDAPELDNGIMREQH